MRDALRLRVLLPLLVLAFQPAGAETSRDVEITPVLGFRSGGSVDSSSSNIPERAEADPSLSYGVVVDYKLRADARIEFLADRQELHFEPTSTSTGTQDFDWKIDYFHVGGVYEPRNEGSHGFVAIALGVSHFDADGGEFDETWAVSGSLGGGIKVPVSQKLAMRFELRGFGTFADTSMEAVCGPGCVVSLHSDGWYQLAGRVGLVFRP